MYAKKLMATAFDDNESSISAGKMKQNFVIWLN